MTAIIYIRVSSDAQVEGTSLGTQETDCRGWCAKNDHVVTAVYRDEGESAKTADRPGLIAAIAAAKKTKADAFVVYKLDRLVRNATDGLTIRSALRAAGCQLVSASEPTSADPVGDMVGTILMAVAQLDNSVRAQRCRRGMESTAMAGGWVHKAPIGYALDKSGRIPILQPHPEHGPLVATALKDFASGAIDRLGVGRRLQSVGVSPQRVVGILHSAVYAGIIRSRLTGGRDVPAAFPGLIDLDTYHRVQTRLDRPRQQHRTHRPEFPLVGVSTCGVCGKPIKAGFSVSKRGKRYGYYDCRGGCVRARVEDVHAHVGSLLDQDRSGSAVALRKAVMVEIDIEAEVGRAERDKATKRADAAEVRLSRLTDAYADGLIPTEEYRIKAATYRLDIREGRMDAVASQVSVTGLLASIDDAIAILSRPSALWDKLDVPGRKMLVRTMFGGIILEPNGECRTPDKEGVINELSLVDDAYISNGGGGGS
jgi:site-specific DNA recombinase